MKSLYFKITLWVVVAFFLSVFATFYTVTSLNRNFTGRPGTLSRMADWQMDQAVRAYQQGGPPALAEYMRELNRYFPAAHYLLDASTHRDLLTGEDRSALLQIARQQPRFPWFPGASSPRFLLQRQSPDGRYRFLIQVDPPVNQNNLLLPIALIFLFLSFFSYGLFRYLASPLRQLSAAVERFGQGDLSSRVAIRRSDEIGALSARFNEMADRIQTLLAAERRLLEDVSHELRSPLARMQFALAALRSASDQEQAIARVRKEIDRLGELVAYLLEVTRAEGDPQARSRETLDLSVLVASIVDDSRIEADAKHCTLAFSAPAAFPLVVDRELIRRAAENILRNAIRYSPEHSTVQITLAAEKQMLTLTVEDRGPGVPPEMLDKIFQPFFRVDASRTASTGGVGLGLAIAQRAVALHGGRIQAENTHPGLRVRIELPQSN